MKLIEKCERETKDVNYFGIELTVDADINFLATDDDGCVFGYLQMPKYDCVAKVWVPNRGQPCPVAIVDLDNKDGKNTLVEV
ncbi:hypothetical protein QE177_04300 [Arsenophonus sp. aPb]|uniref:hypothetical protein n=1 Tax=Arsenophonus sp. aPb TaxID=3041619 RepID=UPI0024697125|nr:hypothetical protein [Arsenophonus sp. aPb]WGL99111.1 hypothetical protein QE177_04300 [Arsenophonus sp. aPb]